jgi:hypothetical protein
MFRTIALTLSAALLVLPLSAASDYLTKEGKLTEKLVVKDVQGGFVGFTGKQYTIDPDGSWDESTVKGIRLRTIRSGTLTKTQLAKLAEALKKYDVSTLKNEGKPMANPRVIGVTYGKTTAELNLPGGAKPPKPDTREVAGRFAGILTAVRATIPAKKK